MSEQTKSCNLTKAEIKAVMQFHGFGICDVTRESHDEDVERINYLNKRLLSFGEVEIKTEDKPKTDSISATVAYIPPAAGWGTLSNG